MRLACEFLLARGAAGQEGNSSEDWLREAGRGAAKDGVQGVGLTLQLAQLRLRATAAEQPSNHLPLPVPAPGPGLGPPPPGLRGLQQRRRRHRRRPRFPPGPGRRPRSAGWARCCLFPPPLRPRAGGPAGCPKRRRKPPQETRLCLSLRRPTHPISSTSPGTNHSSLIQV